MCCAVAPTLPTTIGTPDEPARSSVTAGRYLSLRREAAGQSIDDIAAKTGDDRNADMLRRYLTDAEAEATPLPGGTIVWLSTIIPIDVLVYQHLVAGRDAGPICVGCGCTWDDACWTARGPCAWSTITTDFDVCTICAPAPIGSVA